MVPKIFLRWKQVFGKVESKRMLTRKVWDHTIDLVTNFIQPYLHQFFNDSHGLKVSLKPLGRPFDRYQLRLEVINNGRDIRQINW